MTIKDEIMKKLVTQELSEDVLQQVMLVLEEKEKTETTAGMLDIKGAMEFLKISRCYVYLLRKRGILKSYRLGKRIIFDRKDLLSLVKKNRV
jgi:hypothetical protein